MRKRYLLLILLGVIVGYTARFRVVPQFDDTSAVFAMAVLAGSPDFIEPPFYIETEEEPVEYAVYYYCDAPPEIAEPTPRPLMIAIDPGHQGRANYQHEQNGPGSSNTRARVATGTRGVSTGIPEHELNLEVSLMLRDELRARGYNVFMIRETADVDISNRQRALMAAKSGADIFVRIHANGNDSSAVHGIMMLSHSRNNPYVPHLYESSRLLSDLMLEAMVASTGARNMGVFEVDTMSGSNWSRIPVTIVEMGFMTNPHEDELMATYEYRTKLVNGMANGIDQFFASALFQGR